jgi:hypothetical protein
MCWRLHITRFEFKNRPSSPVFLVSVTSSTRAGQTNHEKTRRSPLTNRERGVHHEREEYGRRPSGRERGLVDFIRRGSNLQENWNDILPPCQNDISEARRQQIATAAAGPQ